MNAYCTLFDSNYLSRGLAMYASLMSHAGDFRLYVFPFDEKCRRVLDEMKLPHMTVVPLEDLEDERLLAVKPQRSKAEYCWTCASHVIWYTIDRFGHSQVTYLDADLFFFGDPSVLLDEFRASGKSALISPHRYTPKFDLTGNSGIYCVQFMTFKSDDKGMAALSWWQERCLEWCFARAEDGKFGDQKYLDDWPQRFEGVHVLQHRGGGVAPWNVQQYDIYRRGETVRGREKDAGHEFDVIFYHFHSLAFFNDGTVNLCWYPLSDAAVDLLYRPYLRALELARVEVRRVDGSFDPHGSREHSFNRLGRLLRSVKRRLMGNYNFYDYADLIGGGR